MTKLIIAIVLALSSTLNELRFWKTHQPNLLYTDFNKVHFDLLETEIEVGNHFQSQLN
jgi:hypothetical protein